MSCDMKYVVDIAQEILAIPSPGGDTDRAVERIEREFASMNIPCRRTAKGALIAVLEGQSDLSARCAVAHVDTLGAVVRRIEDDGRLRILPTGGFSWCSVEGENCTVFTLDGRTYNGSLMPDKASRHAFHVEGIDHPRTDDTVAIRLDEDVNCVDDVVALGIGVGDMVSFEPRTVVTQSGYVKSRHLDDKACVAVALGACRHFVDSGKKPARTTYIYISNYEEVGHGTARLPEGVGEMVALDIGIVAKGTNSSERAVSICARDSRTPYDRGFVKELAQLAKSESIPYRIDTYFRYGSDASMAVGQGEDVRFSCIGMGVDATHHYERTHLEGIKANLDLLVAWMES